MPRLTINDRMCVPLRFSEPYPASHLDNLMKNWSVPDNLIEKKFLSPKEVKEILGISLPTVYRMIETRELPAYKVRKSLRVLKDDVLEYLKAQRLDQF